MIQITIDEYVSGYSLDIYDPETKTRIRDLVDTKLDSLVILQTEIDRLIRLECEKRNQAFIRS